jgi:hypothetical protein
MSNNHTRVQPSTISHQNCERKHLRQQFCTSSTVDPVKRHSCLYMLISITTIGFSGTAGRFWGTKWHWFRFRQWSKVRPGLPEWSRVREWSGFRDRSRERVVRDPAGGNIV